MEHAHARATATPAQPLFPRRSAAAGQNPHPLDVQTPQTQYPVTYGGPMPPVQRGARFLTIFVNFFARSLALVALVVLLEIGLPPEYKPSQIAGSFLGKLDAAEMAAKMDTHAAYEGALAQARAEVEKDLVLARTEAEIMANAYNAMYERMNKALEIALQMEAAHLQAKEDTVKASMTGQALASVGNDLMCAMGDPMACSRGQDIRSGMMAEFDTLTTSSVGRIRDELMGDLPDPSEFRNVVRGAAEESLRQAGS